MTIFRKSLVTCAVIAFAACGAEEPHEPTPAPDEAPEFLSVDEFVCTVAEACHFEFQTHAVPAATISGTEGLPSGLHLDEETGILSGSPDDGTGGEYELLITASNGVEPDGELLFFLTILEAPTITSSPVTTFEIGHDDRFEFEATGFPAPELVLTGELPQGLTFDPEEATLSGVLAPVDEDEFDLLLNAYNGVGSTVTQDFKILVGPNEPPIFLNEPPTEIRRGDEYLYEVEVDDADGDIVTISAPELPQWLSFSDDGDGLAVLAGYADYEDKGIHQVVLAADDGRGGITEQVFSIEVIANNAPVIISQPPEEATVGVEYVYDVVAEDLDDDPLELSAPDLPQWLTLTDGGDGTAQLVGVPGVGDIGEHDIVVVATDDRDGFDEQLFTITVSQAPVITSEESLTCMVGFPCSATFAADGAPTPTFELTGALPDGFVYDEISATLTGVPDVAALGDHDLLLTASNGISPEAVQEFTLHILDAPIFVDNSAPAGGDGTLDAPFATLNEAEAASTEGDTIFVFAGDAPYGVIALQAGQRLIGEAAGLPEANLPAGDRPLIYAELVSHIDAILMDWDTEIRGFAIDTTGRSALRIDNVANVAISDMDFIHARTAAVFIDVDDDVEGWFSLENSQIYTFDPATSGARGLLIHSYGQATLHGRVVGNHFNHQISNRSSIGIEARDDSTLVLTFDDNHIDYRPSNTIQTQAVEVYIPSSNAANMHLNLLNNVVRVEAGENITNLIGMDFNHSGSGLTCLRLSENDVVIDFDGFFLDYRLLRTRSDGTFEIEGAPSTHGPEIISYLATTDVNPDPNITLVGPMSQYPGPDGTFIPGICLRPEIP